MSDKFTAINIKEINNHMFIDDDQHILVDTGSQVSFHLSGHINIGDEQITVPKSIPLVSQDFLSEKVGCEVNGLLGMDIMGKHTILFDLKSNNLFFNDDAIYIRSLKKSEAAEKMKALMDSMDDIMGGLGGLIDGLDALTGMGNITCVEIEVNGKTAQMVVDSGARISFINDSFLMGLKPQYYLDDFHHSVGDFKTPVYKCETNIFVDEPYSEDYGILPEPLMSTLRMFQIDGIIGLNLFRRYRLQFKNGHVLFPPQGI